MPKLSPAPSGAPSPPITLAQRLGLGALCALAGTLLFLACADFDIWPLAWIGLLPLLGVLLDEQGVPRAGLRRPFWYGYICGLLANGGGFYWILGLLMRFGHMPWIAAAPIYALLIAYQALTFGIFALLLSRLRAQIDLPVTFLAPLCWTACELCVPYIFPWYLSITQAWQPPLIQVAEFTGPLGVSFLIVLCNGALFDLWCVLRQRARAGLPLLPVPLALVRAPLIGLCIVALNPLYGLLRIHQVQAQRQHATKVKVGVVQANIGIHEKFVPGLRETQLRVHQELSQDLERRGADLIVWPESSFPYPLLRPVEQDLPPESPAQARRGLTKPLLFGALTVDDRPGQRAFYNTALLFDERGRARGSFDKNFLLIFGEYLPYADKLRFLKEAIPEISLFSRGTRTTTFPFEHQGQTWQLGPMICYEDIIPAFGRRLFDAPAPPNLIINITNDAWFGATSEPWEHMALSVYRAIEHRVDLIRAVNTGVSVFIDATGRVYDKTIAVDPLVTPGVQPMTLLSEAALMTPGGLYQRLGESFGTGCLLLVLALGVLARRRADRPVRWPWLLLGAALLHGGVVLTGLVAPGQSVGRVYAALAHQPDAGLSESAIFDAVVALALVLLVLSAAFGAASARLGSRLEALAAVVCVTVVPVLLFGRMEGNTGEVVILTLLCSGAALLGRRLGRAWLDFSQRVRHSRT